MASAPRRTSYRPPATARLRIWSAARWSVVALLVMLLLPPLLLPLLTGHRLVVVDGGSMVPTYQPGDVLLTAPPTGDDLEVGRIVLVGTPPTSYVHRVIEVDDEKAPTRARLKGDANAVPDPGWVTEGDVSAVPVARITGAAAVLLRGISTAPGNVILAALMVGLALLPIRIRTTVPDTTKGTP